MFDPQTAVSSRCLFFLALAAAAGPLSAQVTTINVGDNVLQSNVRRFGMNLGNQTFYDSGQIMKNLVFINPGFEAEIFQSTVRCGSATASSCVDENGYSGWAANFWNGATFEFVYGAALGRTGTISTYSAATGATGGAFGFSSAGPAPATGDFMIVRRAVPGNATAGWWVDTVGAGAASTNTSDLPPGSGGKQTAVLTAPAAGDSARVSSFFDTTAGRTFIQLNGQFQISFKAKALSGSRAVAVGLKRAGSTYVDQMVSLTSNWATYTLNFNASENGTAIGNVHASFSTVGQDAFLLDDVSLVQLNGDPTNTTVFRDPVVNALRALRPGVLRFWFNQLGESLDNLLADQSARQRSGYSAYHVQTDFVSYGLTEFLQLCELVGAEPWVVIPVTLSNAESSNLIDYLAGGTNTVYGAKRAAAGHPSPWTSSFAKIHLEFGNEAWNGIFKGGAFEYPEAYGNRAQAVFGAMRANSFYAPSSFDLVLGGQGVFLARNLAIQNSCNNNDSFSIAPYMMYEVNAFSTVEDLYGSTFAEAEAFQANSGTAEGLSNGFILRNQQTLQYSSHPTPLVTSEMNLSPAQGAISQAALDSYTSSIGAGVAVVDSMLQQLRQGVLTQNLYQLSQHRSIRADGKSINLWGAVVDMGVTDRRRPQFLALQLANQAIGSGSTMLGTSHAGADPTWSQPLVNSVQLNNAHYLQSFAFAGGGRYSLIVLNVHRTSSLPVSFGGSRAPTGSVQVQQLWSANIGDTNEASSLVAPVSSTVANFNPSASLVLPPYSMTVLTWGSGNQPQQPQITAVTAAAVSSNSATISWTTDQPSSTRVAYGTTAGYGSQSALDPTLSTFHSVTLTGLTAGTTYNFAATSANAAGTSTTSGNFTFATTAAPAPAISALTSSGVTASSATISWTTDQPATTRVSYGTTAGYGSQSALDPTLSTFHSVTLTGLTAGTTYNFAATSANAAGASTTSGNFTFATTSAPAPAISALTASGVTASSATISWTTDQPSSTRVSYGTTAGYGSQSALDPTLSTFHSVTLTGLTAGTTYNYAATSANAAGASTTSGNFTFATTTAPAPAISALTASGVTASSATISWTTDQPSSTRVAYGTTAGYGSQSALDPTLSTFHSVTLTGLTAGTTYNFAATSANAAGASTTSGNFTFATTTAPAPAISALTASGVTASSATISWTTDQPATTRVAYGTTSGYGSQSALDPTLSTFHSVTLTGLTAGTTYNYAATSANGSGASTTSGNFTFATTTAPAPAISALTASGVTASSATISWTTDQPSSTRVSYGTTAGYGSQSALDPTLSTFHSVTLTGLTAGTTYNYAATSVNGSGASTTSGNFTFATTTAPAPAISALTASGVTASSATISWTTDQPATTRVAYGTTSGYGSQSPLSATLTTAHSVTLTGLTAGTTYNFAATSVNGSGASTTSGNFTFATTTAPAPAISSVTATAISSTTATISWTTDQPATTRVAYGTTSGYGSQSPLSATLTTAHSVTLTGLTAGTTYNYAATSANGSGASTTSGNFTFATTTAPAPAISSVTATAISSTTATISWTTDQPATTRVAYGTTAGYGAQTALDPTLATIHSATLTGLTPGTNYFFAATSANGAGTSATSSNFSFTTATAPSSPAPAISSVAAWPVGSTTATIVWTTDQNATSVVNYGTTAAYGSSSAPSGALGLYHFVPITGLTPNTVYYFSVASANASGAPASSAGFTFKTAVGSLPAAPMITAVSASGITSTSATITWTTDQGSTTRVSYGTTVAYGSQSALDAALVTQHSATLAGLTPGTIYNFAAISASGSGQSTTSANFTFATAAATTPGLADFTIAIIKGYDAIKEGAPGTFKLRLTPSGGFSGAVDLGTPAVSPAGVSCNAVGQVTVAAGAPLDVTITCPTSVGSAPAELWTPELSYTYPPYAVSVSAAAAGLARKSVAPLKLTVRPWQNPNPAITTSSWTVANGADYQAFTVTSPWTYSGSQPAVGNVEILIQDQAAAAGPLSLVNSCRINLNHLGTGYFGNNNGDYSYGSPVLFGSAAAAAATNNQCALDVARAVFTRNPAAQTITWTLPVKFRWTSRQVHAYLIPSNENYRSGGYLDAGVVAIGGSSSSGPAPDFAIAIVKGHEAVKEGAAATFKLRLSSIGGFAGAVALGTPEVSPAAGVACGAVAPVALAAGAQVDVTITCATVAGSAPAEAWTPEVGYTYAPFAVSLTATASGLAPKNAGPLKLTVRPWQNPDPAIAAASWNVANGSDYQVFTVTSPWVYNGANPAVGNIEILLQDQAAAAGPLSMANACRIDLNHLGTGYLGNNIGEYSAGTPVLFGGGGAEVSNSHCALNVPAASFTADPVARTITWTLPVKLLWTNRQVHLYARPTNENYRSGGYRDAGVVSIGQ